ncbi:DUF6777 domain-containing protein, partial [Streptomyces sp. FH025]|uniref:DUF6777 domain-containing protein n=1 Tax=Streptomyces sp. FH025 TaxID=2815937 RepID=UPI001A9ED814
AHPPTAPAAQQPGGGSPAALHDVQGGSAGLYGGTMGRSSCDTEQLITMVSSGDAGRAWASAAGIDQSAIPAYLRSLTSAYLRVDARVTNHSYKSGAVVEYQSVLEAGTAVLVDPRGVPRVRCACGNPLKPAVPVSDARYTGKAWAGFAPTALVMVVPAPQPVAEIVLVNIETGGWFSRLTGRAEVVDRNAEPPSGPLAPGVPPPVPWRPPTATPTPTPTPTPMPTPTPAPTPTPTPSPTHPSTPSAPGATSGPKSPGASRPASSGATPSRPASHATTHAATPSAATPSEPSTSEPPSETGPAIIPTIPGEPSTATTAPAPATTPATTPERPQTPNTQTPRTQTPRTQTPRTHATTTSTSTAKAPATTAPKATTAPNPTGPNH